MKSDLTGKIIFFATSNVHKFDEARVVLSQYGLATAMIRMKGKEIQSDSLAEIAAVSASGAYNQLQLPTIVEDAGLFINALNGFPGPYAAYIYKTIGNAGILTLMQTIQDRQATFRSAIAYCESSSEVICFEGEAAGRITKEQHKGERSAFGFDPIFQPDGVDKTFAEMTLAEKNRFSHRAAALREFAEWYKKHV